MATRLKLNKNTLRDRTAELGLYTEFLPTLELRKQQLERACRETGRELARVRAERAALLEGAGSWLPLLRAELPRIEPLVGRPEVHREAGNVAGVRVPSLGEVRFQPVPRPLLGTPPLYDAAIALLRAAIVQRESDAVLAERLARLERERVRTTQRINLYEKLLIPEARADIRRIRGHLGDQLTAAVCRAKIAKDKRVRAAQEAPRGHR